MRTDRSDTPGLAGPARAPGYAGASLKHLALWLAALIVLAACQATGELPSPVPSASPAASATAPATPSATVGPPTPSATLPRPTPSATVPAPTLNPSLVTPRPPELPLISQQRTSPDGQWQAESSFEFLEGGAAFRVRLVVRKTDGSVEWVPVDYTQKGIGYSYPTLRFWSPDSRYFYYFNMPVGDGCGDFYPVEDAWTRLSVADGSESTLLLPEGRGHTISPDGKTMIYATSAPPYGLRFRDLASSTEQFLPLPPASDAAAEVQAGGSVWSPDGASLALSVAYGDPCMMGTLSFSVVRIDSLAQPALLPLVEHSPKLLRLVRWGTADRILVQDWNGESWWIDSHTGQPAEAPAAEGPAG